MDKNNRKSFTLMEILIVASIIVVLSGTSIALFSTYQDDKILGNQSALFISVLELAKSKASAADISLCGDSADAHVTGYSVVVDPTKISLVPGCDTVPTPMTYPITTNIEYIPSSFTVKFNNLNYEGSTAQYILKNTVTSKCKFVQIDKTGFITNGDITCP